MGTLGFRSRFTPWSLALLLCTAGTAVADEPSPEVIEQAHSLYEDGANAYRAGQYLIAEMNFRRVHNLLHAPSVLFDLALAQEKQKKWGEAAANFEVFLRDSTHPANREQVEKRAELLRELYRRSRLTPAAAAAALPPVAPPAEEWELDSGETVPPVAGGANDVPPPPAAEVPPAPSAPGATSTPGVAGAPAAASSPATVATPATPPAATAAPATPPAPEPEKQKASRWWVWAVVGGVAVAAVAVGVGLGVGLNHASATPTDFDFMYGALTSGALTSTESAPALVRF